MALSVLLAVVGSVAAWLKAQQAIDAASAIRLEQAMERERNRGPGSVKTIWGTLPEHYPIDPSEEVPDDLGSK
jgi:hypothetical protein